MWLYLYTPILRCRATQFVFHRLKSSACSFIKQLFRMERTFVLHTTKGYTRSATSIMNHVSNGHMCHCNVACTAVQLALPEKEKSFYVSKLGVIGTVKDNIKKHLRSFLQEGCSYSVPV